jgi:ubiquinone/menaquinone biosynthesis C-methylase UbiE
MGVRAYAGQISRAIRFNRSLLGIDLSESMVAISEARLGSVAKIIPGDMGNLSAVETDSSAAILSFFAIHHIDSKEACPVFQEWPRVLHPGG